MSVPLTEAALELAHRNGELVLHYQPKVCLLDGRVIGAEALVRWNPGETDAVSPSAFLPLAERSGLLHDITITLLGQVVDACARMRRVQPGFSLSMNVAPSDLDSDRIAAQIADHLAAGRIRPDDLQIEITEGAVMKNFERVQDGVRTLRELGIAVLMDDFGTGYSSIDRLSQLPFASLKLDQGVVRRMGTSRQNLNVVKSAIAMARELDMISVAEGVESAGAYYFLMANGCRQAQGYWIARPMSLDELESFVVQSRPFAGSEIGRVHQTMQNLLHERRNLMDAAFCIRLDRAAVLPSVADPEIASRFEDSRTGSWYFAVSSELSRFATFRALEQPLRTLHTASVNFVAALQGDARAIDRLTAAIDRDVDEAVRLLHGLERDLLAEALPAP